MMVTKLGEAGLVLLLTTVVLYLALLIASRPLINYIEQSESQLEQNQAPLVEETTA
jgi:hypothetical protein